MSSLLSPFLCISSNALAQSFRGGTVESVKVCVEQAFFSSLEKNGLDGLDGAWKGIIMN